ncbi:MAG TPA: glycoside hydrolase family 16 protein [Terriglobales bacterium]|nr:glycoside hydrolase family 16 protein [Terriglobales bacterium]
MRLQRFFPPQSAGSKSDAVRDSRQTSLCRSVCLLLLVLIASVVFASVATPDTNAAKGEQWKLTWSDEFSGPNNSLPDESKWSIEVGGHWANNELQAYTNRPQNIHLQNGNLVITATKEDYTGTDGVSRSYTSARMKTEGKFTQKYGRIEARMKLPHGQGMWPAFWLLGDDISAVGWPECGEIDIMENVGSKMSVVLGTIHGPGYSGGEGPSANYTLPKQQNFSDDFHVFAIEWEPAAIRFYVDGNLFETRTPADIPPGKKWVFDHPYFVILNLAVGGNLPGSPDATTQFPQSMLVDYVRVYEHK